MMIDLILQFTKIKTYLNINHASQVSNIRTQFKEDIKNIK